MVRGRDLLCPLLKRVFGEVDCISPEVGSPHCLLEIKKLTAKEIVYSTSGPLEAVFLDP